MLWSIRVFDTINNLNLLAEEVPNFLCIDKRMITFMS